MLTEEKNTHSKAAHVAHALGIYCTGAHPDVLMKVSRSVRESFFAGF